MIKKRLHLISGLLLIAAAVILTPAGPWLFGLGASPGPQVAAEREAHASQLLPVKVAAGDINLAAKSALLIDFDSAKVLYSKNPTAKLPIASITKLVTVMVILGSHALDETVTISGLPAYHPEAVQLGLAGGQRFKLGELVKAALIPSANDAADALAIYHSGSVVAFTKAMNQLATEWGIAGVHFTSASGLDEAGNYATAEALAKLAKVALAHPSVASLTRQSSASITDLSGRTYPLVSTNRLLGNGYVVGLKTGYTPEAGQSFLGLAEIKGHKVISVVLNSPDRFGESQQLYRWAESSWQWL